ncbi:immunity 49 family protein [Persicobacter psychrovividus]|uniref:Uncharacterized protein n=1 Tax=Persicobacter psychrovividus TaxID=387638 RepID=A0ABM7VCW5_9BACT|nr:hypothetical protein PEPS_10680 [Persicobacter psychrovividus]
MINRHKIREEFIEIWTPKPGEKSDDNFKCIPSISEFYSNIDRYNISYLGEEQLKNFTFSLVANLLQEEYFPLIHYSRQYGILHFKKASNPDQEIKQAIGDREGSVKGRLTRHNVGTDYWEKIWCLCMIFRDKKGQMALLEVPKIVHENAYPEPYVEDLAMNSAIRHMQHPDLNDGHAMEALGRAFEVIKNLDKDEDMYYIRREMCLWLDVPLLRVFGAILSKDEAQYNKELEEAINLHKEFYSIFYYYEKEPWEEEPQEWDRPMDENGWIAWRLLAAASIAYDRGLNTTVESEYIPSWLYKAEFDGLPIFFDLEKYG